jgi:hypothetical protein
MFNLYMDIYSHQIARHDVLEFAYVMHTSGTTRKGQGGLPVYVPEKTLVSNIEGIR